MPAQIAWDQYEAAFLLEYCIKVEDGLLPRAQAVAFVSQTLRKRAISKGITVDDVFRNENGISMQMAAIRNCYLCRDKGLTVSKVFREVVAIYKNDKTAFAGLLQERSYKMSDTVWQEFLLWLKDAHPQAEKETLSMLTIVNVFGHKSKLLRQPINEVTDKDKIVDLQNAVMHPHLIGINAKKTAKKAQRALGLYLQFLESHESIEAEPIAEPILKTKIAPESKTVMTVDFDKNSSYAHTKPVSCLYRGSVIKCPDWNTLYINVVKAIQHEHSETFPCMQSLSDSKRIDIGPAEAMIYPKEIVDGLYLECNVSATYIVNKLRSLMDLCVIPHDNLTIEYQLRHHNSLPVETGSVEDDEKDNNYKTVHFGDNASYVYTKPVSCLYKGSAIRCSGWNELYINTVKAFYIDYSDCFPAECSLLSNKRIDIGTADEMIYPKEIADGHYLECNNSATGIVKKLHMLMDMFNIPCTSVVIKYRTNEQNNCTSDSASDDVGDKRTRQEWVPQYTQQIASLIASKYKYGFRIGSPIEMMRLRNYAEADEHVLPETDEDLDREIRAAGMVIDGKVFAFGQEILSEIGTLLDSIFRDGVGVVFLEPLYQANVEWMEKNYIASTDMLKELLRRIRPACYFGQNIITPSSRMTEYEAIVAEIHRVGDENRVLILAEMVNQLPYLPADKISWCLSCCSDYVWISEGCYFNMKFFTYNEDDADAITRYVAEACLNAGYASITDIPMGSIPDENYELTTGALYSAIYEAILRQEYHRNGKILTTEVNGVDLSALLKAYCNGRTECTASEVMNRAMELTGVPAKQHSLAALFDTMIRIDGNRFVAEDQIHFDVDRIDSILESIVGTGFAPIRAVTTFALFPICGTSWNAYLLESYCYRFSRKYRLCVLNYNDKNVGMITFKTLSLTYNDMLSEAAANAKLALSPEIVGNFFFDNGYTAKRSFSSLPEIIEKANTLREDR